MIYKNREAKAITEFYRQNKKDLDKLAVGTGFILFVYLFVKVLFAYIAPFAVGLMLALIFEPIVSWLSRRFKINRGVLAFLAILTVISIIGSVGTIIIVRIVNEARAFFESLPYQTENLARGIESLQKNYINIIELIPEELRSTADSIGAAVGTGATSAATAFVSSLSTSVVKFVPGTFIGIILCFVSMFFFIKDRKEITDMLAQKCPAALIHGYNAVKQRMFIALAGYVRAEAILMSITAIIAISGLLIIRYPYALFLGLLIAGFDFLPVFGPGFILWPWALTCAVAGEFRMAIGLMIIYAVISLVRQAFEPKILGSQIGVHPLITLMSMFIGLKVLGALGLLLGPFTAIILKALNEIEW